LDHGLALGEPSHVPVNRVGRDIHGGALILDTQGSSQNHGDFFEFRAMPGLHPPAGRGDPGIHAARKFLDVGPFRIRLIRR
jgi:hypothetical protein